MIKTYKAIVEFPIGDEPYDAGHGPSYNVALKVLDGNGEHVKDVPRANKYGLVSIYKKETMEKDIEYMRSLSKGDTVTIQLNESGKKATWDFVPDMAVESASAQTAKPKSPKKQASSEKYTPLSDMDKDILADKAKNMADVTVSVADYLRDRLQEVKLVVDDSDILRTASGLRISAERTYVQGTLWPDSEHVTNEDLEKVREDILRSRLDGTTETALNEIVNLSPSPDLYSVEQLREHMNALQIRRELFGTNDGIVDVAKAIWQMLELMAGGMEEGAAVSATREIFKDDQGAW